MATQKENRILIAMDGSTYSDYAFKWYLDNIKNSSDYVILVHCVDFNAISGMPDDTGTSGVLVEKIDKERKSADIYLESLAERLRAANVQGKVKRCTGSARVEILRVAEEERIDMIITGTRGRGKIKRTLLGSVSDHVLHHAHVPVIICRHKDDHHQHH